MAEEQDHSESTSTTLNQQDGGPRIRASDGTGEAAAAVRGGPEKERRTPFTSPQRPR